LHAWRRWLLLRARTSSCRWSARRWPV